MTFWASDLPGFGLRVRSGGGRTWLVQLRVKSGETQRHTLGDAATVPFAKARSRAQELLAQAKLGGDPAEARKRARESIKVEELASAYLRHQQARMKPRSYDELRRHMEAHAKPLHRLPAAKVMQRAIVLLLQASRRARRWRRTGFGRACRPCSPGA